MVNNASINKWCVNIFDIIVLKLFKNINKF